MEFMKYPSIENSYRENSIERWLKFYPELLTVKYILTEKIHGANFSILITSDEIEYGKRTNKLEETESFFNYQNVVANYEKEFKLLQSEIVGGNGVSSIRVFGEIFGSNIQKGVYYGKEKQIRLFDCYINDELITQENFLTMLYELEIQHMFVPTIAIVDSLEEALAYDIKFNSKLIDLEDNICEGVVIKPYDKIFQNSEGSPFYLKNKNAEFSEKSKEKNTRTDFQPSEQFEYVLDIFKSHINMNRLDSIFSKYGVITEPSQMGDYIRHMTEDAKGDFIKDYRDEFLKLNDKEKKRVFSCVGQLVVPMLKDVM